MFRSTLVIMSLNIRFSAKVGPSVLSNIKYFVQHRLTTRIFVLRNRGFEILDPRKPRDGRHSFSTCARVFVLWLFS